MTGAPQVLARFAPRPALQVVMILGLLLFAATAVAALLATPPDDESLIRRISLWIVIVLCPVYAVDLTLRFLRHTPTVVATDEGIAFRSILGFTPSIPWVDIAGIAAVVIGKKLYLAIYLKDPNASLARFRTGQRLLHVRSHAPGDANIALRAIHLGMNPPEAAQKLERIRLERTGMA